MKAGRLSVRSNCQCYLRLDLLLIVIIQKKAKPCNICGRVFSRATDLDRHMKTHDPNARFVLLFFNLLIL